MNLYELYEVKQTRSAEKSFQDRNMEGSFGTGELNAEQTTEILPQLSSLGSHVSSPLSDEAFMQKCLTRQRSRKR